MNDGYWNVPDSRPGDDQNDTLYAAYRSIRPIRPTEPLGYVDSLQVAPGDEVTLRCSVSTPHTLRLVRLGETAILTSIDADADRLDAIEVERRERDAAPLTVHPGSYIDVPSVHFPSGDLTVGAWIRPWRLPPNESAWNWSTILGAFDYPGECHWALIIQQNGFLGAYHGDGGPYHHDRLELAQEAGPLELGQWVHALAVLRDDVVRLYINGGLAVDAFSDVRRPDESFRGPVRIGASAQRGIIDNFLDADISQPFIVEGALDAETVHKLYEDAGVHAVDAVVDGQCLALWRLSEPSGPDVRDVTGNGGDGLLVNHASRRIPGPGADRAAGRPGYDPEEDDRRGHALRLSSDDLTDCHWPVAERFTVPEGVLSGFYSVEIQPNGRPESEGVHVPFVVSDLSSRSGSIALLVPTFTWAAYGRRPIYDVATPGLSSTFYTRHSNGRMHFNIGLNMPIPRASPYVPSSHRPSLTYHQHLVMPERIAASWLRSEGYDFDLITDDHLDGDPSVIGGYDVVMIVGHSEYWSTPMREGLRAFLDNGGDVVCLSGNTMYWRVTYDQTARVIEARKTSGEVDDDSWLPPEEWGERWHSDGAPGGTWSLVGQPTHELLGLEFLGWSDEGDPTSFGAYVALEPEHFLFTGPNPVRLRAGQTFGHQCINGGAVSGYEMDGIPEVLGVAVDTTGRDVLATARGQGYIEAEHSDTTRGADLIFWERPAGGRVFNAGSIAYSGCLPVDGEIANLTRNVLHHFGVRPSEQAQASAGRGR